MSRHCLIAVATLLLAACAGAGPEDAGGEARSYEPDPRPLATTLVYECEGYEFVARLGPGEMAVWLHDRYLVLSRDYTVRSIEYREGGVVFIAGDDVGEIVVDGQRHTDCRDNPRRAPWEDARRRGVAFRAVGNEPGWHLEIQPGRSMLFVAAYGIERTLVLAPLEEPMPGGSRFRDRSGGDGLDVEIIDQPCADSMSGETFPAAVLVSLAGRRYSGCGRRLDFPWVE